MNFDADRYLGRVYTFTDCSGPDMTIAGRDPARGVRLHGADGGKFWIPAGLVIAGIAAGALEESSGVATIHT